MVFRRTPTERHNNGCDTGNIGDSVGDDDDDDDGDGVDIGDIGADVTDIVDIGDIGGADVADALNSITASPPFGRYSHPAEGGG